MAFINSHNSLTVKTELDIFAVPNTQNSVESGQYITYRPLAPLGNDAPIEFVVSGSSEEYLDLAHTMIYIKAKITKPTQAPLIEKGPRTIHNVGPVNNWMHSMFSQVDVSLNQKCISPPSNCYNYRAYIENLLNYGSEAKSTHLESSFWNKDTAGHMNAEDENTGYKSRRDLASTDTVELFSNIHCDIFNQDKYLLNGVELTIKFIQSKPSFHLMSDRNDPQCTFEILAAELFVRKVKINPSIQIGHAHGLLHSTAKYPITRVDIKQITLPAPIQSKSIDNLYMGHLPKRCIIGMVKNSAFNGNYKSNPFNFEHFNLNYLSLYVDSTPIPSKPFTPNFADGHYMREYNSLFSGCGIHYSDAGNDISHSEYPLGYFLTVFDLTSDLSSSGSHWNIQKNGSLRIEFRFSQAIQESVTVIIFSEFDNLIEIDKNRQVTLDYAS
jgi:hypothetical protein